MNTNNNNKFGDQSAVSQRYLNDIAYVVMRASVEMYLKVYLMWVMHSVFHRISDKVYTAKLHTIHDSLNVDKNQTSEL